jgi:hypothetical protein
MSFNCRTTTPTVAVFVVVSCVPIPTFKIVSAPAGEPVAMPATTSARADTVFRLETIDAIMRSVSS